MNIVHSAQDGNLHDGFSEDCPICHPQFDPRMALLGEAYRAFDRWCREHDPDGNMDIIEQAAAYTEWAGKNSIEKYLDAAQPVNVLR